MKQRDQKMRIYTVLCILFLCNTMKSVMCYLARTYAVISFWMAFKLHSSFGFVHGLWGNYDTTVSRFFFWGNCLRILTSFLPMKVPKNHLPPTHLITILITYSCLLLSFSALCPVWKCWRGAYQNHYADDRNTNHVVPFLFGVINRLGKTVYRKRLCT